VNTKKDKPQTKVNGKPAYLGTGRRKTSTARIMMIEGTGQITINGRAVEDYFTEAAGRNCVYDPLDATDMRNRVDLVITVAGGGITGQAGAVRQGIARALKAMFGLTTEAEPAPAATSAVGADGQPVEAEETTSTSMSRRLRDSGFLTRDGRMKERKKYGRKGARKSFQFSKR
jgi:small subunit ribosomal protein S9